jgi:hypothetical protein
LPPKTFGVSSVQSHPFAPGPQQLGHSRLFAGFQALSQVVLALQRGLLGMVRMNVLRRRVAVSICRG